MEYAFILQRLFEYSQSSSDAKIQWLNIHNTHTTIKILDFFDNVDIINEY